MANEANQGEQDQASGPNPLLKKPEEQNKFGSWILVQRQTLKPPARPRVGNTKQAGAKDSEANSSAKQPTRVDMPKTIRVDSNSVRGNPDSNGSRFAVLRQAEGNVGTEKQDMEVENVGKSASVLDGNITLVGDENNVGENHPSTHIEDICLGEDLNSLERINIDQNHVILRDKIMEVIPITKELPGNEDYSYEGRRSHNNWKEDVIGQDHNARSNQPNILGLIQEKVPSITNIRWNREEKEKIVHLYNNNLSASGKENSLHEDSTEHTKRLSDPPDPSCVGQSVNHESCSNTNHPRNLDAPGVLDVHRLRHRWSIDGQMSSTGAQGGASDRFLSSTPPQSTRFNGHGSTPSRVSQSHEHTPGHVHGYSA